MPDLGSFGLKFENIQFVLEFKKGKQSFEEK